MKQLRTSFTSRSIKHSCNFIVWPVALVLYYLHVPMYVTFILLCFVVFFPVRFAHLINIDFFQDLMSVLHSLSEAGVSASGMLT